MKKILDVSINKLYIMVVILISLLMLGGYFSYAMFTVSKEKSNAISIVTGNLIYDLKVDGEDIESLTVPAGTTKIFTVTLTNPNNRIARFNFYYLGSLPDGVTTGYSLLNNGMVTPVETGINLEKTETSESSNTYRIVVVNDSDSEVTINLGVEVGLDYNDLTLPENGHLFEPVKKGPVGDVVVTNKGDNGSTYDDGIDTFLTGEEPDNYIWYSGKLWRAVLVNNEEKTVKLVTEWNITTISYSSGTTDFAGSYMEQWLNDTTVDGFLGNLRYYENFLVTDAKWNTTLDSTALGSLTRPSDDGTIITDVVGLLNMYEYQTSYMNTDYSNGYLNNGLYWWSLTPHSIYMSRFIGHDGNSTTTSPSNNSRGVRPAIYMKANVCIVDGDGTVDNPYRLEGDNDKDLSLEKLNTRYSGEYIRFGSGNNNLYRIVSHENKALTKIVSAEPLKDDDSWKTSAFGSSTTFSSTNTIGSFLNGEYLTNYLTEDDVNMIEDNTTWYLGIVNSGVSYKLAKYEDETSGQLTSAITIAKVGLLRYGELMSGQFIRYAEKGNCLVTNLTIHYWNLTPYSNEYVYAISAYNSAYAHELYDEGGIKPVFNLKSNVIITSGDGTKNNPFEIKLNN